MFPLPIAGLALAGKLLLNNKSRFKLRTGKKYKMKKARALPNPMKTLLRRFKGLSGTLTSVLSKITKTNPSEDYAAVVGGFLPPNARLLAPKYPLNSREVQLADLDGDSQDELIASFKQNNEIRTMILKKQSGKWSKLAESVCQDFDTLRYRSIADLGGQGKRHLLLGLASGEKMPVLSAYSLEGSSLSKIFSRSYHRFEMLNARSNRHTPPKAHLAFWKQNDAGCYDIDMLHWNGRELEAIGNTAPYYFRNVVPYYAGKLNQSPHSLPDWYGLADSLWKAGAYREARAVADMGLKQDKAGEYRQRLTDIGKRPQM